MLQHHQSTIKTFKEVYFLQVGFIVPEKATQGLNDLSNSLSSYFTFIESMNFGKSN